MISIQTLQKFYFPTQSATPLPEPNVTASQGCDFELKLPPLKTAEDSSLTKI